MKRIVFFCLICVCFWHLSSCKKDDNVYAINGKEGINPASIIRFERLSALTIEADTVSEGIITLQVDPATEVAKYKVGVTTSLGAFANGASADSVNPNAAGVANFIIRSKKAGTARITATIGPHRVDTSINFLPALPHDLILTADKHVIDTSQSLTVTIKLLRDPFKGVVSDPVKVFYSILPALPASSPFIYPASGFSDNGTSTITLTNPFFNKGQFLIEAKALGARGDTLRQSIPFTVR